jgi:hypothetical protein
MVDVLSELFENEVYILSIYIETTGELPFEMISLREFAEGYGDVLWLNRGRESPSSFLGLVQIVAPRIFGRDLCLASVAIKTNKFRNFDGNERIYMDIVKSLKKRCRPGIWGINTRYGGKTYYKNIYVSDGAMTEVANGMKLVPEGGGGYVVFEQHAPDA